MTKKIGIMTTGGDCSGLNTAIKYLIQGCNLRGWEAIGILDGTDGLYSTPAKTINLTEYILPVEHVHLSGSILSNGYSNGENFQTVSNTGKLKQYNAKLQQALKNLHLDALVLIGGNGSLSLAHTYNDIYKNLSLVCIPKTIDMDVPLTEKTIGFDTAVQQLTSFCDQLLLTARSHHRWFVVQAMGRKCGKLALDAGIASGADAILIPEIKFDTQELIKHIKNSEHDYGIIMVSEGISLRGHSGNPADIISRQLTAANIPNKTAFPEYLQRAGDTVASDRLLATGFANAALEAIDNKETNVIVVYNNKQFNTVSLQEFFNTGRKEKDPRIKTVLTSNAYVEPDDINLKNAINMGIYIGKLK
ncbi:MAG: 6-phosphofructokinase [Alphaproteobacteria bacterium]|nr:6-phosphofructokinase [Alphaproteobacteria bacterium]